MITIYIAHTVSYKADPSFTACCSGVMGFHLKHLALCLWPRRLLQHGNISGCLTAKDPAHEGLRRRFMPGVLATRCMQLKAIHLNSPPPVQKLPDLRLGPNRYLAARSPGLYDRCGNLSQQEWRSHLSNTRHMIRKSNYAWGGILRLPVGTAWREPVGSYASRLDGLR